MEKMLNNLNDFFTEFPEYIYLLIGFLFLVLFIGILKNKNWAVNPNSGNQRLFYQWFGPRALRVVIGFFFLLGTIGGFGGYYLYGHVLKIKEYNNPINSIENIESKGTYGPIVLTIENYSAYNEEIIASFKYEDKKARIKFDFDLSSLELQIVNIGKESDYFLYGISELFGEKLSNATMKSTVNFSFLRKGDYQKIDLFDKTNLYSVSYKPNHNKKGSVQMRMKIDMELGTIKFWEKNGGIAKKNLIKAFEKN